MRYVALLNPDVKKTILKIDIVSVFCIIVMTTILLFRPKDETLFRQIVTNLLVLSAIIYDMQYALKTYMAMFRIYKFGRNGEFKLNGCYVFLICIYIPFVGLIRELTQNAVPLPIVFIAIVVGTFFYMDIAVSIYIDQLEEYYNLESVRRY